MYGGDGDKKKVRVCFVAREIHQKKDRDARINLVVLFCWRGWRWMVVAAV